MLLTAGVSVAASACKTYREWWTGFTNKTVKPGHRQLKLRKGAPHSSQWMAIGYAQRMFKDVHIAICDTTYEGSLHTVSIGIVKSRQTIQAFIGAFQFHAQLQSTGISGICARKVHLYMPKEMENSLTTFGKSYHDCHERNNYKPLQLSTMYPGCTGYQIIQWCPNVNNTS